MTQQPNGVTELVDVGTHVCIPGEAVLLLSDNAVITAGSGLANAGHRHVDGVTGTVLCATVCGPLQREKQSRGMPWKYFIASNSRYQPKRGDTVVGTVVRVLPMTYQIALGSSHMATLDGLAFDGASKASRPRLRVGDHVYCHVAQCDGDSDIVVSCCALPGMDAKEWTTGESTFGGLHKSGQVVRVSQGYAQKLVQEHSLVLSLLGERVPYEIAAGLNGRVWVKGTSADSKIEHTRTIAVASCIVECQNDASPSEIQSHVDVYFPPVNNDQGLSSNNASNKSTAVSAVVTD